MKEEKDYIRDIAEIRSMMERSTKFLSLSGWAGVMAGIYALTGAYIAYKLFDYNPAGDLGAAKVSANLSPELTNLIVVAIAVLVLAISTAIYLSSRNAVKRNQKLWNPIAKQLVIHMAVPLIAGGLLILIFLTKGMIAFVAPFSLLFYGLALFNSSKFTYTEVKSLGLIQVGLGLFSSLYTDYGLLCWALGFGVIHIIYGIYMHFKYER